MSPIPAPLRRKPQVHGLFYWLFLLSYVNYCDKIVQTRVTPCQKDKSLSSSHVIYGWDFTLIVDCNSLSTINFLRLNQAELVIITLLRASHPTRAALARAVVE